MSAAIPPFHELALSYEGFQGRIIGLDPGETTGYAILDKFQLIESGQLETGTVPRAYRNLHELFCQKAIFTNLTRIACEDYRIYSWKAQSHAWSEVHTIKVVALIQLLAHNFGISMELRTAQIAKQFMTDQKLETWGFYQKGQRHARDAIRHAAFDCLFGDGSTQAQPQKLST